MSMITIDINSGARKLTVQGGGSLLETLRTHKVFIPSACGGQGICGYCKVKVLEGAGSPLPVEEPHLDDAERAEGIRLSCQVKVRNNLKIRIPAKLLPVKEYACRCERIKNLTCDIKELRLRLPEGKDMNFIPGQYVQFRAPRYNGSPGEVSRAYSIASDPADAEAIELIIRRVPGGICTTYVFEHFKEGDEVLINGPYGEFRLSGTSAPMVFIAGGSGIAPIKCILHHVVNTENTRKGIFFFGVRALKDLFMSEEMRQFEKAISGFKFVPALAQPEDGDDWNGAVGRVTDVVAEYLAKQPDAAEYEGYLCGSPGMIDAAVKVLADAGIAEDRIYYDKFS